MFKQNVYVEKPPKTRMKLARSILHKKHEAQSSELRNAFVFAAMSATFHANVCDRLLQQQLPLDLQAAGVVVKNTFIDFKTPVHTGVRKRAQSEGANPTCNDVNDDAGLRTPSLWDGEEQSMQVALPIHFTFNDSNPNSNCGDQGLIGYWMQKPNITAAGCPICNTSIELFQRGERFCIQ